MRQLPLFDGLSTRARGQWRSRRSRSDEGTRKRWITIDCTGCGVSFEAPHHVVKGGRKFCSDDCKRRHQHPNGRPPKRTRRIGKDGYVWIYVPSTERPAGWTKSQVLEHRYVMARVLGRPLLNTETVHHINGDKTDNRPANLELHSGPHGKTCRYRCCDCGSRNIEAIALKETTSRTEPLRDLKTEGVH